MTYFNQKLFWDNKSPSLLNVPSETLGSYLDHSRIVQFFSISIPFNFELPASSKTFVVLGKSLHLMGFPCLLLYMKMFNGTLRVHCSISSPIWFGNLPQLPACAYTSICCLSAESSRVRNPLWPSLKTKTTLLEVKQDKWPI